MLCYKIMRNTAGDGLVYWFFFFFFFRVGGWLRSLVWKFKVLMSLYTPDYLLLPICLFISRTYQAPDWKQIRLQDHTICQTWFVNLASHFMPLAVSVGDGFTRILLIVIR